MFERVRRHFDENELINLTLGVMPINAWNRICIAFRPVVGEYRPRAAA